MNKKGQSLVFIILLMPIIIILLSFSIELGNIYYQKHRLISITKTAVNKNENIDSLKQIYEKNNINVTKVTLENGNITVNYVIKSYIGSIIKKDKYASSIVFNIDDGKIIIKEG